MTQYWMMLQIKYIHGIYLEEIKGGFMMFERKRGIYEIFIKRLLDILCSVLVLAIFGWLYLVLGLLVKIKMGSPVIFKQARPGKMISKTGRERIFWLYKYRTMEDKRDKDGELLPDAQRLNEFGRWLRRTSLDEIPEIFNILVGDMSVIGPRPQLVRDLVFMDEHIRLRHTAKPGLTGLAQVNGRNAVTWDKKFELDLQYIQKINFVNDIKILAKTVYKVVGKNESSEELEVTDDYGDWLLRKGRISQEEYIILQKVADRIVRE